MGALILTLLVGACAPQGGAPSGSAPAAQTGAQPRAPKIVTIAILRELDTFVPGIGGRAIVSGADQVPRIAHNLLAIQNDAGEWVGQLAEQVSTDRGTWRVNPDGTTDTIWRLRPNVKWHDGTPFTSADMLFTFEVYKHPEILGTDAQATRLMLAASAPDSHTFEVHWSAPYIFADRAPNLPPVPRHLTETLFSEDIAGFINSPLFNSEFVGLGPYRLLEWERGSHMRFTRFDEYYLGRPPLDAVVVRFMGDPNTMIANVLSGAVDVLLPVGVDIPSALDLRRRWEGTGNMVVFPARGTLRHLELQNRLEYAEPKNGLPIPAVRQGLYSAIDRQELSEVVTEGVAPVADSWISKTDAMRGPLESSIPKFPYDLARAQQYLTEAGWAKGPDGMLVHTPSGERFDVMLFAAQISQAEKEQNVIAQGWKALGAQVTFYTIPSALAGDFEHRSKLPGAGLNGMPNEGFFSGAFLHSKNTSGPNNRWSGANRMGYYNPKVDEILDKLVVTIPMPQRLELHKQLLAEGMGTVMMMPLYENVDPVIALKAIKGIPPNAPASTRVIFQWDRED